MPSEAVTRRRRGRRPPSEGDATEDPPTAHELRDGIGGASVSDAERLLMVAHHEPFSLHLVAPLSQGLSSETGQVDFESTGGERNLVSLSQIPSAKPVA